MDNINSCFEPQNLHTSTFDARKTQVGAMSTGSILFREYLQVKKKKKNNKQKQV